MRASGLRKIQSRSLHSRQTPMIESGFWIFIVEAAVAGMLFAGLIWWVVKGTSAKDRAKMEELRRKAKVQDNGEVRENDGHRDS
jgi:hypothetical protein